MRDSRENRFSSLLIRDRHDHGIFLAQVDTDTSTAAVRNLFTGCIISALACGGRSARAWPVSAGPPAARRRPIGPMLPMRLISPRCQRRAAGPGKWEVWGGWEG